MPRFFKRVSKKAGLSPGTLVHVGKQKVEKTRITVIRYGDDGYEQKSVGRISEAVQMIKGRKTVWINIDGLHDVGVIQELGEKLGIHPLVLEDVVNTGQRPKLEDFEDYMFIVMKMLTFNQKDQTTSAEQVSLIPGKNFVITFQERPGDIFDPVRKRLKKGKGRIRKLGSDYLAYALIDTVVDEYFSVLESFGEKIEGMEEGMVDDPKPEELQSIHGLKREMIFLRKSVWPLREVISGLDRSDSRLIKERTHLYIRDVYDHTVQVIDTVETFRDMASGLLDLYLSSISNRMNQVMKVLTIIATIFIPLSFFAGLYGMNFNTDYPLNMPELGWEYGYPALLLFMLALALLMLFYFRRRKWL
jgi:magnesium transporter